MQKVSQCEVFSGPYFPVFGLHTGKYKPEKTFYAMDDALLQKQLNSFTVPYITRKYALEIIVCNTPKLLSAPVTPFSTEPLGHQFSKQPSQL